MRALRRAAARAPAPPTPRTAMAAPLPRAPSPPAAAFASSASSSPAATTKLWGGRFTGKTDPLMEKFNNSLRFDRRLWRADIEGSRAYAQGLLRAGLLSEREAAEIKASGAWLRSYSARRETGE